MSGRVLLALCAHSLKRIRAFLLGLALLLAAFQFLLTQMGAYLVHHSAFGELSMLLPDFVRTVAGPSALAFMSFNGVVALGYFHPIVVAACLGLTIAIATEPAAEVDTRFVDLTLSRDLTRTTLVTRTALVFLAAAVLVLASMVAGTTAGLACCTPPEVAPPATTTILSLATSLGSVMFCWAGLTMAVAGAGRRRAAASGIVGVAALAAYLLDYLGRAWEPARAISAASPFHYFEPTALVMGQRLNAVDVATLIIVGILGAAIAFVVFERRDI